MKIFKIAMLCMLFSSAVFGQARKANQTNTDYLIELMNNNEINDIYIVCVNFHFKYNKEWLKDVVMVGDYITFKNIEDEEIHSWDISNTTFIERAKDVIKIRLSVSVGQ